MSGNHRETDEALLGGLRSGDATAFAALVDGLHGRLLALARTFTSSPALAEDIVQETWLGVIRGIRGFEGRSSLRTWIFSILIRRARTMAAREARRAEVPMESGFDGPGDPPAEWEPGRGKIGLWQERPVPWGLGDPAMLFQSKEALDVIRNAVEALPAFQRQAVILRDIEDVAPAEICNILGVSETNLRVLLHRGRARIRLALDRHLRGEAAPIARSQSGGAGARNAQRAPAPEGPSQTSGEAP